MRVTGLPLTVKMPISLHAAFQEHRQLMLAVLMESSLRPLTQAAGQLRTQDRPRLPAGPRLQAYQSRLAQSGPCSRYQQQQGGMLAQIRPQTALQSS